MADIKAIAEELVNLTVKEVNELATVLKDEYGRRNDSCTDGVRKPRHRSGKCARCLLSDTGTHRQ